MTAATAIREAIVVLAHMPVALSPSLFDATARRWSNAIANKGFPSINFTRSSYVSRSAESCRHRATRSLDIDISSDIGALLAALPLRLGVLLSTHSGEFSTGVTDMFLDAGCLPAIVANGNHTKLLSGPLVTQLELECVVREAQRQIQSKSSDRSTMASLHRLAIIRSTTKDEGITAIMLLVGRVVRNQASMLRDFLFASEHEHKSILVLDLPGSGKTTLLRDIARCLSDKQDAVYVVDTWSELGGGGANAHEYIGSGTRRIMVASRDQQAETIRECVRNHRVRTLVVDEVESEDELMALWSAKERGVRLVVGVQGSLASLLQDGGASGHVVRTAVTQQMRGSENLLAQRGRVLFESVVELDATSFTTVKMALDFARGKWDENRPVSETRCYNSSTGAICTKLGGM